MSKFGYCNVMDTVLVSIITVSFLVPGGTCYPKGAPTEACYNGLPLHGAGGVMFEPQKTPSPYQIKTDVSEFRAGDTLIVTIASDQGMAFRGIFMQVRPLKSDDSDLEFRNKPLGRFFSIVDNTKPLTCDVSLESETHKDAFAKYNLTIKWKSPLLIRNDVVVRATLVADYSTFWTNVESPRIKIIPEKSLPVESLEKPWLREIMKTVSAEGDKKAKRALIKERFEKGYENLIEPHGYIMVHYLTDILPIEESYPPRKQATTELPNVSVVRTTTASMLNITTISSNKTTGNSTLNETMASVLSQTSDHSKKLHYEDLVKTLLKGEKSVVNELNAILDETQ